MTVPGAITTWVLATAVLSIVFYVIGKLHLHVFSRYAREQRRLNREISMGIADISRSNPELAKGLHLKEIEQRL